MRLFVAVEPASSLLKRRAFLSNPGRASVTLNDVVIGVMMCADWAQLEVFEVCPESIGSSDVLCKSLGRGVCFRINA